ncbi:TPA: PTS transporter subunit EIIC, partial [Klebsiella pneumoniae]
MKRFNLLQMLQSIGRSLMIPIAMLPAAGILLAFGVSFQDLNIVASLPFLGADWLVHVLKLMAEAGSAIFANLPLLFAVG